MKRFTQRNNSRCKKKKRRIEKVSWMHSELSKKYVELCQSNDTYGEELLKSRSILSTCLNSSNADITDAPIKKISNDDSPLPTHDYPSSWTEEMIRYYFEPNEKHKHFDYEEILRNIDFNPSDWKIGNADRYLNSGRNRKYNLRCERCNQRGHAKKHCKKYTVCYICGGFNHSYSECPNTLCFTCGRVTKKYLKNCHMCRKFLNSRIKCTLCNQIWHEERLCPSKWRKYLTTKISESTIIHCNSRKFCYNCAEPGHFGFECSRVLDSDYPPENPFKTALPGCFGQKEKSRIYNHVIFLLKQTSCLLQTTAGQHFLSDLSKSVNIRIEFFVGEQCYIKLSGDDEIVDYCRSEFMKINNINLFASYFCVTFFSVSFPLSSLHFTLFLKHSRITLLLHSSNTYKPATHYA